MKVVNYRHELHYQRLKTWLAARNIPIPTRDMFAQHGYCVNDVAIGFLVSTDCGTAYFDHVAVDPKANREARNKALTMLATVIEQKAQELGYRMLIALINPQSENLQQGMTRLGFHKGDDFLLYHKWIGGEVCHG